MPQTAAQIVNLANQIAKTPAFSALAGQKLNAILQELCQTYDFEAARGTTTFQLNFSNSPGTGLGSGPYLLPADYLRTQQGKQFYTVAFQPYELTRIEQWEYDLLTQQPGFNDFPRNFYVDMSPIATGGQPQEFVWPPPSISTSVLVRYFQLKPDIVTPETSATIPWFPNTQYLITRLAGEMMQFADDDRAASFLTDKEESNPQGAGVILRRYLNLKDDPEGRAKTVSLDRRRFGISRWDRLPSTKTIGWP
jgi:hypothetical protein